MKNFHMVLPFTVAVIKDEKGRYLVGRHPNLERKPYPGKWDMPGGKAEETDETFEAAVAREVKEETGFDVTTAKLLAVFHHSGKTIAPDASPATVPGIGICYMVEVTGDLVPSELEDMHWVSLEELDTLELTPWCKYLLENFL